jgi:hypothetical protein
VDWQSLEVLGWLVIAGADFRVGVLGCHFDHATEIGYFNCAGIQGDEDVVGFDVEMGESFVMEVLEGFEYLPAVLTGDAFDVGLFDFGSDSADVGIQLLHVDLKELPLLDEIALELDNVGMLQTHYRFE